MKNKKTVILGMSGGVDSSVSAYLLKEEGYNVIGVFMRNWDSIANNDILGNEKAKNLSICPEEQDWMDAQAVAKILDIPIYREDFINEYWDNVFENLISEYKAGRTPNPDILCNKYIKFGQFLDMAYDKYKADFIATGHYANIVNGQLTRGLDKNKDQSYFLAQVSSDVFKNIIFPIGQLQKSKVREIANKLNLITANKKDSTGICFIGERDFSKFLQNYIPAQPGNVVNIVTKKIIGTHNGVMYYTIGQRKGLDLGGMDQAYYVAGHDLEKKIIYVSPQSNPDYLISDKCVLKEINWISPEYLEKDNLTAKFRYRQQDIPVTLKFDKDIVYVSYKQGCSAVTPGQQCVIYYNDVCVGGGVIDTIYKKNKQITYV